MINDIEWDTIFSRIKSAGMVIVVDDSSRENEGDLVMAAELVTEKDINFMSRYGRGLICMPMTKETMEHLQIPMMVSNNQSSFQPQILSVDWPQLYLCVVIVVGSWMHL